MSCIPEGVNRLFIVGIADKASHLAYALGEEGFTLCNPVTPIKVRVVRDFNGFTVECRFTATPGTLACLDEYYNEVTCEKCLAIASGRGK